MDGFIGTYQYFIGWSIYLLAGLAFSLAWWKLTSNLRHSGWRDLLRGITLVVIFTPWYVSEAHEHVAPAAVVVLIDLLLGSTDNGLTGSLALLISTGIMLIVLISKRFLFKASPQ